MAGGPHSRVDRGVGPLGDGDGLAGVRAVAAESMTNDGGWMTVVGERQQPRYVKSSTMSTGAAAVVVQGEPRPIFYPRRSSPH